MQVLRKTLVDVMAWDDQVRFVIPKWQRHYVWTSKENSQLWEDWSNVCAQGQKHFCGVMLFRQLIGEENLSWEIVDGQQRMTTFFIFFIALRDYCHARQIDFSQLDNIFVTRGANQCRLDLREGLNEDNLVLNALLRREPETIDPEIRAKSAVNDAYNFFTNTLTTKVPEEVPTFVLSVLEKLDLVILTVDPQDDVRRLFESLNSRGKHIEPNDLVANLITYIGTQDERLDERARDTWNFVSRTIADEDLGQFLETFGQRNGQQTERGTAFDEIKFEIDDAQKKGIVREWLREFERAAWNFNDILFPENTNDPLQQLLEEMKRLRVPRLNPFLLALLESFRGTPASVPLIHNLVSLIVRLLIKFDRPAYRLGQFADKAGEAFYEAGLGHPAQLEKVIALIDNAWIDDETFHQAFTVKAIYGPGAHLSRLRYYLEKFEQKISEDSGMPFELHFGPQTTVEHIMPQTLDQDGYWKNALRTNDKIRLELQHQSYVDTIGNLTVLLTKDNPAAGNAPYSQKRDFYLHPNATLQKMGLRQRRATIGTCALNTYFENVPIWNFQAIANRSKYIADLALTIWNKQPWSRETK
jgi:uncharacterized protein with ParB-like and HNH nuclease domain